MNNPRNTEPSVTLLHVEGVNLGHSIGDTEQLSTRRGGGLLLLEAVNDIAILCTDFLERISTGASVGLFRVKADCDVKKVAQNVRNYLAGHPMYQHATFMVSIADGEFNIAKEQVLGKIRWQQMQSLSFSMEGLGQSELGVCKFDEVRPVRGKITVKRDDPLTQQETVTTRAVSASVAARHNYGRIKKQAYVNNKEEQGESGFYATELAQAQKLLGISDNKNLCDEATLRGLLRS